MYFDRSRPLKVIDFYTHRMLIYEFLLVINCDLSCMFYVAPFPRYNAAKFNTNHPTLKFNPRSRGFTSNFLVKLTMLPIESLTVLLFSENYAILTSVAFEHALTL